MIEIYFNDLNEEVQKLLLEEAGVKDPSDANWDVFPIATLDFEERRIKK